MFLDKCQPTLVLHHGFSLARLFIREFRLALFRGRSEICKTLVFCLLTGFNSKIAGIRQNSAATLYFLMRCNYEKQRNFGRSQLQIMGAIFRLISEKKVNEKIIHLSLEGLKQLASNEREQSSTFGYQKSSFSADVKQLICRIRNVLNSTQQMKLYEDDPEMFVELQHIMAQSYCDSPEHRKTWLEEIGKKHEKEGNLIEAAMCHIHIGGLLAELLYRANKQYPAGCRGFNRISGNIERDEAALKDDEELQYTPLDLADHLQSAADLCGRAEMYELVPLVLSKSITIFEQSKQRERLRDLYRAQAAAMDSVIESRRRFFGKFYRVAFYGKEWEDYDQRRFIYKEPKITQLNEVRARLETLYSNRFGADKFEIITDSKPIEEMNLELDKHVYLQLTSVEPYFNNDQEVLRDDFERAHQVNQFFYETPFTKEGPARTDDVTRQWMTSNIITTVASFPYCKKRIEIEKQEAHQIAPAKIAINSLQNKNKELHDVINRNPVDIKQLQLRLQGSVMVTVNSGSLTYAHAFLGNQGIVSIFEQ